ncbi:MAG: hypothetical protein WD066_03025 [Planctomycetaceae bacterium]
MHSRHAIGALAIVAALLSSVADVVAAEAPAKFTKKPVVSRDGAGARIDFAVDRETDVAVSIENAQARVIRHLVAGVLGQNPPAPLKANSLEQSVTWDGKDDAGAIAQGGPFRVRVALGLTPVFDAKLFDEPQRLPDLHAIAAGPGGELYIRGSGRDGGWGPESDYRVLGRDGKYVRTVAPFPANLPLDRVAELGAFPVDESGGYIPRIHEIDHYCFYPVKMGGPRVRITQIAVDDGGRVFFLAGNKEMEHIGVLDKDGGVPEGWSFTGKGLSGGDTTITGGFLAVSSDGKRLYVSGASMKGLKENAPAVLWTDARERGPLQVLCGDLEREGAGKDGLKNPAGIATDGKGHVLVADAGNGRVAVISEADGKIVGEIPVADPGMVGVDRRTGAVYVVTASKAGSFLVKFSDWKEHREIGWLSIPSGSNHTPFLAVSSSTPDEGAVAWIASNKSKSYALLRVPDLGTKFGEAVEVGAGPEHLVEDVFVDRARDEVYVNLGSHYWRFKDGTDDAEMVPISVPANWGLTIRVCPRGNIYGHAYGDRFLRWDRDGTPLDFQQTGKNLIEIPSMMVYQLRGLHIDQLRGEILIVQPNARRKNDNVRNPDCFGSVVRVYDLQGNFLREALHGVNFSSTVGPAVDAAGNIYIGEPSRPNTHELPAFFKGKLPDIEVEGPNRFFVSAEVFPYSWAYGSVVKFSSKGGSIPWPGFPDHKNYRRFTEGVPAATDPVMYSQESSNRIKVAQSQGVLWAHGEFYPLPSRIACNCLASYFDVDYFGRSFYPDAARSRVGVLDTNGNVICRFGAYGNREAEGDGGYVPLAMGIAVAASDEHIYVADMCNRHLVRAKMTFAAEETSDIQ